MKTTRCGCITQFGLWLEDNTRVNGTMCVVSECCTCKMQHKIRVDNLTCAGCDYIIRHCRCNQDTRNKVERLFMQFGLN